VIRFSCPRCQSVLESPDPTAGGNVLCPTCHQKLQVPLPPRDQTVLGEPVPAPVYPTAVVVGEPTPAGLPAPDPTSGDLTLVYLGIGIGLLFFLCLVPFFGVVSVTAPSEAPWDMVGAGGFPTPSLFSESWHGKVILVLTVLVTLGTILSLVLYLTLPRRSPMSSCPSRGPWPAGGV
jgi:hypothetical protein